METAGSPMLAMAPMHVIAVKGWGEPFTVQTRPEGRGQQSGLGGWYISTE